MICNELFTTAGDVAPAVMSNRLLSFDDEKDKRSGNLLPLSSCTGRYGLE